ncbi:lipase family protein [Pragia fontium]|uniref:lipase family protein n=1 Tax=Pragia fontium TaxID=82985 RepID=UPI00069A9883|nr:lipase family protein [Pragia fontium]
MDETRTSIFGEFGKVVGPVSNLSWCEIQLVDDHGDPVAGMTYWGNNDATRDGKIAVYTGKSDADGIIRLDDVLPLNMKLTIDAQSLADEMEKRTLRSKWITSYQMEMAPITGIDDENRIIYQVVIGKLCNKAPNIRAADRIGKDGVYIYMGKEELPKYHFPDPQFSGLTILARYLRNQRIVIKICPFRAWNLVLHHQKDYSIVNAYNLGIMAALSYGNREAFLRFMASSLDLSEAPHIVSDRQRFDAVVVDVPFSERYTVHEFLDTDEINIRLPDSQLFYIANKTMLLVAWRGTQEISDCLTDIKFWQRPHELELDSQDGFVHTGFWEAFDVPRNKFKNDFDAIIDLNEGRELFLCGHSLGGALAVIHAATLKRFKPVVYTYGMPRVFTYSVVIQLDDIIHYRHINDGDVVTTLPPHGIKSSMLLLASEGVSKEIAAQALRDIYMHHGSVVIFFKAEQSQDYNYKKLFFISELYELSRPYLKTKFYVVPSLYEDVLTNSEENQQKSRQCSNKTPLLSIDIKDFLCKDLSLDKIPTSLGEFLLKKTMTHTDNDSLRKYFPPYENPTRDSWINPFHHLMLDKYLPYINNQLLELVDKERELVRVKSRQAFIAQMEKYQSSLSEDGKRRNQLFIELQDALGKTLIVTQNMPGGENALLRFRSTGREDVEN